MAGQRLLGERALVDGVPSDRPATRGRAARSVTVNMAESPLGWLLAHRHISRRQYDAGERLRADYERGALGARVTMSWAGTPVSGRGAGANPLPDLTGRQIDARARFEAAVGHAGAGLADILWRVVCAGEGMREAESALGWPARSGKLVLTLALDRVADYYRVPGRA